MHHVVVEEWSRRDSLLHRRDARVKLLAVVGFLLAVGTAPGFRVATFAGFGVLLVVALVASRLPVRSAVLRAAIVLPFSATFALFSVVAGEPDRAASILSKSYLSALGALCLVATTPLPRLARGLESLGVPKFLVLVLQFLYRYLFVISEQAQHMRQAAAARGASARFGFASFRQASGAVAVLFARSYARAEGVHEAMLARGFAGKLEMLTSGKITSADVLFLGTAVLLIAAVRIWVGGAA